MASPIKSLSYINGTNAQAWSPTAVTPSRLDSFADSGGALPPPLWKPLAYASASGYGPTKLMNLCERLNSLYATKLTIFWRNPNKRPRKGQLWPRTR